MSRSAAARSFASAPRGRAAGGAPVGAPPPPQVLVMIDAPRLDPADPPRRGGRVLGLLLALEALSAAPGALE